MPPNSRPQLPSTCPLDKIACHLPPQLCRYLKILLNKLVERPTRPAIEKAFRLFDFGAKGVVDAADLRRIADQIGEQISDEEIGEMITEANQSKTGSVDLDEFFKIVTSYAQHYDGDK
eukprot:scaffold1896_cov121-Isochrysis_galbana.AAC.1